MCTNTGLLQVFQSLDGMMPHESPNLTFFHDKIFPKEVPCVSDLKIADLAVGTERIRAVEDTKGRENWHTGDITKSQDIFDKLRFRKCPKCVLRNIKSFRTRSKLNTFTW